MTEFKFSCPHCGQHLAGTDAWVGRSLTCPTCQSAFTVPAPAIATPAAPPPPPSPLRPAALPRAARPAAAPDNAPHSLAVAGAAQTSKLPLISLVLGIVSLVLGMVAVPLLVIVIGFGVGILAFLCAVPGVICGHLGLSRIKSGRASGSRGMAIAGLVMSYLTVLGSVALVGFATVMGFRAAKQVTEAMQAQQGQRANSMPMPPRQTGPRRTPPSSGGPNVPAPPNFPAPPPSAAPFEPESKDPKVTTDPTTAQIPATPVAGTIRGQPFRCEKATLESGMLKLRQGKNFFADLEVVIFVSMQGGERPEGKNLVVTPDSGFDSPHVHVSKMGANIPDTKIVPNGYAMRLEFDKAVGKTISGKIYLELPQSFGTKLAGTFRATTP
jgi:hypothetical protein